ncbi:MULTISPECIES: cytochrome c [unclassified Neptuniibacter]|uniref:c-type cytochrome n=1 Tax=unclassified Neptuniibacter TaxID=2630693 RepID=UPI000C5AB541|nr:MULTISPECIES: cytochrome c [unclassified Neptuniibacter]MAY42801.1 cytochrome C [Oceanospirillaceae bacterium]|tara:strand:- start:7105 stop:7536 length:432 start_codon:yes stop_codon:yes gene_type:complete
MNTQNILHAVRYALIALTLTSGVACAVAPPVDTKEKTTEEKTNKETPEYVAEMKAKVFSKEAVSVQNGEKRFNQTCVYCHGHQGSGGKARKLQGRDFDSDYLFKTITKGKKRGSLVMPPWKRTFTPEQRWELVTYIMSLSEEK